jgi:hypothetical protein
MTARLPIHSRRAGALTALLTAAVTAVGATSPATAAGLTNPGFETGDLTGWAALGGSNATVTSSAPHSGGFAAAVSRKSSSGQAAITDSPDQFTQVAAGTSCTAAAWVKGPSGLKATVKWFALNGTTRVSTASKTITFNGSWQQSPTASLTMPSGASTADLRLYAASFPVGQTWYVDDVTAGCGAAPPPPPPTGLAGHWAFDESGTPAVAADSSGNHNDGTDYNIQGDGQAYSFNGTNSRVIVPTSSTLNPGTGGFSFGVTLLMTQAPAVGETYDVLRKGLSTTAGGDYKFEVANVNGLALGRCIVRDSQKVAAITRAGTSLADGAQHDVTCTRAGNSISISVDGVTKATKTVTSLGTVSNSSDLAVGAKAESSATTGFDWYLGKIYDAWVRMG